MSKKLIDIEFLLDYLEVRKRKLNSQADSLEHGNSIISELEKVEKFINNVIESEEQQEHNHVEQRKPIKQYSIIDSHSEFINDGFYGSIDTIYKVKDNISGEILLVKDDDIYKYKR